MFVREYMSKNPVTITPDISVPDALRLMKEKKVRRLPVLNNHGKLIGIVSEKDLLLASPSPVTSLAVWELTDLMARLKVESVMKREVITISEDTPLEEAARKMVDHKIGGLPVMHGETMVGIITETDLFKQLLAQLGGRRPGVRLTVAVSGVKGTLAKITEAIFNAGGNIVGLGLNEGVRSGETHWEIMFKVQDAAKEKVYEAVRPVVIEVLDSRESP